MFFSQPKNAMLAELDYSYPLHLHLFLCRNPILWRFSTPPNITKDVDPKSLIQSILPDILSTRGKNANTRSNLRRPRPSRPLNHNSPHSSAYFSSSPSHQHRLPRPRPRPQPQPQDQKRSSARAHPSSSLSCPRSHSNTHYLSSCGPSPNPASSLPPPPPHSTRTLRGCSQRSNSASNRRAGGKC